MKYKLNSGSTDFISLQSALEATIHICFTLNTQHGCSSALSWPFSSWVTPPPPCSSKNLLVLGR